MQTMRETMARIQQARDPAERRRLMQEHMESMHAGMSAMGEMMRGAEPSAQPCTEGGVPAPQTVPAPDAEPSPPDATAPGSTDHEQHH